MSRGTESGIPRMYPGVHIPDLTLCAARLLLRVLGHVHKPLPDGVRGGLDAILQVQFLQDVVDVVLDGSFRDKQAAGDLRVTEASRHQLEYLELAGGEVPGHVLSGVAPGPLADLCEQLSRDGG